MTRLVAVVVTAMLAVIGYILFRLGSNKRMETWR